MMKMQINYIYKDTTTTVETDTEGLWWYTTTTL